MDKYLMTIDMGTTGTKAVIFDLQGHVAGIGAADTPTYFPVPGRVEQNAQEVVELLYRVTREALQNSGLTGGDIRALSFTCMCCTFVPVDREGHFLRNIILHNDFRGTEMFPYMRERLASAGIDDKTDYDFTGLPFGPLATTAKFLWLKKNEPEVYEKTYKFIGMQALMVRSFTDNITDYCDDEPGIIYTKLSDCNTFTLDPFRAALYDIDITKYTGRKKPGEYAGEVSDRVAALTGLKAGTPVYFGAGDQRCAAIGAGVARDGLLSGVLGTSGVIHAFSSKPVRHKNGSISILGHAGTGCWQVEGSTISGASSLRWFRDLFCQAECVEAKARGESIYQLLDEMAEKSPVGANGIVYTPWLGGCDCPRFDGNGRACFIGLSFSHKKEDTVRAVMEGVCYEMKCMIDEADEALGITTKVLRTVGGGAKSRLWNQIQADVYNKRVETLRCEESTALGAAMCAAIGLGVYRDVHEAIENMVHLDYALDPIPENVEKYQKLFKVYKDVYKALAGSIFPEISAFQRSSFQ